MDYLPLIFEKIEEREINDALNRPDSAAGPDGWTSSQIAKIKRFSELFVKDLH